MHRDVLDSEEMLAHLFAEAKALQNLTNVDEELKAQFVWYLCVRTAGFIENSIQTMLSDFFESGSVHPALGYFVSNKLIAPNQFTLRRVRELIDSFKERESDLEGAYDLTKLESSVGSIQSNRNHIAHGGDAKQLTILALDNYFEDARKLVRMVYEECNSQELETRN